MGVMTRKQHSNDVEIPARHHFTRLLAVLVFALWLLGGGRSFATVYVDKGASPGGDGNSWSTAYQTIQAGINDADTLDAEVWVAEGVYTESITMKDGVAVYGGFDGTESHLSERDVGAHVTTIDGAGAYHVVVMDGITNSRIDGLTITGGNADGTDENRYGGGLYCVDSDDTNTVANCTINSNSADVYGGGMYNHSSSPSVRNCMFSNDSAARWWNLQPGLLANHDGLHVLKQLGDRPRRRDAKRGVLARGDQLHVLK
jgi:hypothetical protein